MSGDERLIRYLLGELPEDERLRLEEEYLADPGLFARVLAAEDDLIDAYARGELTGEARLRFEQRYGRTADQQQRIIFAGVLQRKTRKAPGDM